MRGSSRGHYRARRRRPGVGEELLAPGGLGFRLFLVALLVERFEGFRGVLRVTGRNRVMHRRVMDRRVVHARRPRPREPSLRCVADEREVERSQGPHF